MAAPGFDAAAAVRLNAEQLDEYMRELFSWSKDMKKKASGHRQGPSEPAQASPPVNAAAAATAPPSGARQQAGAPAAARHPAGHTYEHYRDKWDKFDVDTALADAEGQGGGTSTQLPPARGGGAASGSTAAIPEARVTVPVVHSKPGARAAGPGAAPTTADGWKDAGNAHFKAGRFAQAAECYSASLALQPSCLAHANRAMASLKLGRAAEAEADCSEALALDPLYTKAYQRRATARRQLGRLLEAVEDCEAALRLEPNNTQAAADRTACVAQLLAQHGLQPATRREPLVVVAAGGSAAAAVPDAVVTATPSSLATKPSAVPAAGAAPAATAEGVAAAAEVQLAPRQSQQQAVQQVAEGPRAGIQVIGGSGSQGVPAPGEARQAREERQQDVQQTARRPAAAPAPPSIHRPAAGGAPPRVPRTGLEFEKGWKGLKSDRQQQAAYLLALQPAALPALLRQALTPGLLAAATAALLRPGLQQEAAAAVGLLEGLVGVPRFDLNLLSVPPRQRAELAADWDGAAAALAGGGDAELAGRLATARQRFKL